MRYNEGPGVKLSDSLVFHPGLAIEGRYDSNVLFTNTQLKGAPYLRLIGHFNLATLSPQRREDEEERPTEQRIQFGLNTSLAYREYFSGTEAVTNQRALEIAAGLNFRWTPSRYFYFEILDNYTRAVQARNFFVLNTANAAIPSTTLSQDLNRLTANFGIIPGGGRLSFGLGYSLDLNFFEDTGFDTNNKLAHEIAFTGKYKLLPMTALMLEVIQQFTDYTSDLAQNVGSKPFKVYAGFGGLFTPRFSALVKVGYGNSIHDSGASFSSVLAKAELGYSISATAKIKVGFERSFADSQFANYYQDIRAYAGYDHMIAGRFILHGNLGYTYRAFDGFEKVTATATELQQNLLALSLAFDYQIKDWVYVGIGYDLQLAALTGTTLPATSNLTGAVDFTRHQVYGKVGISY